MMVVVFPSQQYAYNEGASSGGGHIDEDVTSLTNFMMAASSSSSSSSSSRLLGGGSVGHNYYGDHGSDDSLYDFPIDNTSFQCAYYCPAAVIEAQYYHDKPLWWLVLRWMKMMLFKIARSYHAKPILLVIIPIIAGIIIGFYLAKLIEYSKNKKRKATTNSTILERTTKNIKTWISVICLGLVTTFSSILWTDYYPSPTIHDENEEKENKSYSDRNEDNNNDPALQEREDNVRVHLNSEKGATRESDVPLSRVPKHVAIIMDGNRRYGKARYGSAARGHWDGSSKVVEFAKWCLAEKIKVLTVFAFSSENWNRDPAEVASLMQIFAKYCDELRVEALKRNIKIVVLSTDEDKVRI